MTRAARSKDPFLPLDAEFWNDDHTRYTVFFDPGRQKRGIPPNQQMGRSLEIGKRYTLVVSRDWPDGKGLPLKEQFRKALHGRSRRRTSARHQELACAHRRHAGTREIRSS